MASCRSNFSSSTHQDVTAGSIPSAKETPPALDSALYPATYGSSWRAGLSFFLAYIGFATFTVIGRGHLLTNPSAGLWIFAFGMLGLLALIAMAIISARVTLYPDRIERKTWIGTQVMRRADIAGKRLGRFGIPELKHKDIAAFSFRLPLGARKDAAWNEWMASVPDLDALDEAKILTDIEKYPKLGATFQERKLRWDIANNLARICIWVSGGALLLIFLPFSSRLAAAVLIISPWVVLLNMSRFGVLFKSERRNPALGHFLTLFVSGVGLALFSVVYPPAFPGFRFFPQGTAYTQFLGVGPAFGLVLFIFMVRIVFSISQWKDWATRIVAKVFLVPLMMLVSWGYGIGAAMEINTLLDTNESVLYVATVEDKLDIGRQTLWLKIGPWGTNPGTQIAVPSGRFAGLWVNGSVCIRSHAGFLYAWYSLAPCQS